MARVIFKGQAAQAGTAFYYPEWFADLFAQVDGIKTAYIGGWMNEPDARLLNGPDLRQMTDHGSGVPVAHENSVALGVPALTFPGQIVDTGHAKTREFTLIAVVEITATQAGGPPTSERLIFNAGPTNGDAFLNLSGTGKVAIQISDTAAIGDPIALTEGPHVLMVTCREADPNIFDIAVYVDDMATPVKSATGPDAVSTDVDTGGNWLVGGNAAQTLKWSSGVAAFLIIDRDITQVAEDYAAVQTAMTAALVWATP